MNALTGMTRDMEANPYSKDEQRVADFLFSAGVGGGDDPIGFVLSSLSYATAQLNDMRESLSEPTSTRERCASLEGAVRTSLSANGSACACGNGRVPVTAYRDACAAFAAAIRARATTTEQVT